MKKILITALVLNAITTAHAQTHPSAADGTATAQNKDTKAKPETTPATTPAKESTAAATDDSANLVGTNDFYLALIREGVRKA